MANFNRGNRSGGNRNFVKPRYNNDRPEMHQATCANCGKSCEVPFRPTGNKPVYCRECFQNNQGSDTQRTENRNFDRPNSQDRQMYDAVCSNCGDKCQIPFRPSQGRDVFCSRCFEKNEAGDSRRPERTYDRPSFNRDDNRSRTNDAPNYNFQFDSLNAKMDKILNLLTPTPINVLPLESAIDEKEIKQITEEIQEEKKETLEKKPKQTKALIAKPATKTKKAPSPKKK